MLRFLKTTFTIVIILQINTLWARNSCLSKSLVTEYHRHGFIPLEKNFLDQMKRDQQIQILREEDWERIIKENEEKLATLRRSNSKYSSILNDGELKDLYFQLGVAKKNIAKMRIRKTLSEVAQRHNNLIFVREISSGSLKNMHKNSIHKPMFVKAKTAQKGILKGYIPYNQNHIPDLNQSAVSVYQRQMDELIEEGRASLIPLVGLKGKIAVVRDGKRMLVVEPQIDDEIIKVLADADGNPFTSDIDLLTIGHSRKYSFAEEGDVEYTPSQGYMTRRDKVVIQQINHESALNGGGDIIQHGPESHSPSPLKLGFPLQVFTPSGEVLKINRGPKENPLQNLQRVIRFYREAGYIIDTQKTWGL